MVIFEKVLGDLIFSFTFLTVFTRRELGCFREGVGPLSGMPGAVGGAANRKPVPAGISKGASSLRKGSGSYLPKLPGKCASQVTCGDHLSRQHVAQLQGWSTCTSAYSVRHCAAPTPSTAEGELRGEIPVPDAWGQQTDPGGTTYFGRILAASIGVGTGTIPTLEGERGNWQHGSHRSERDLTW